MTVRQVEGSVLSRHLVKEVNDMGKYPHGTGIVGEAVSTSNTNGPADCQSPPCTSSNSSRITNSGEGKSPRRSLPQYLLLWPFMQIRVRIYACGQRYDRVVNTVIGTVCFLAGFGKPSHLLDRPIAS